MPSPVITRHEEQALLTAAELRTWTPWRRQRYRELVRQYERDPRYRVHYAKALAQVRAEPEPPAGA